MILYIELCIAACFIVAIVKGYREAKRVQKEYTINFAFFSRIWLLADAIFTVCYLLSAFLIADEGKKEVMGMVLLAFMIPLYILSIIHNRWYIDIKDGRVECRSVSGKKSSCRFDQITKAEIDEKNNISIYSGDKIMLKIPAELGKEYFGLLLKSYGVDIKYKYKIDDFEMKLPVFYPVMYLCFFIIAVAFVIFGMKYHYSIGIWFGVAVAFGLAYKGISNLLDRVIVKNNVITQTRFLRRARKIECGQVVKAVHKTKDNAPYYYIYSKKGVELKVNMLCYNKELFKALVEKRHWEN